MSPIDRVESDTGADIIARAREVGREVLNQRWVQ